MINSVRILDSYSMSHRYRRVFFIAMVFLSIFHLPIVWIDENSIGLFDLGVVAAYLFVFVLYILGQKLDFGRKWKEYFLVALLYGGYLIFSLLVNQERTLKSILLVVKYFENVLFLLLMVYLFETQMEDIEFNIKAVQMLLVLLVLYQLYHYFSGTPTVSFSRPWLRIGLPYMPGTASNPAGFVLGASILLYTSVILKTSKRKLFNILTLVMTVVALLFTISRTNVFGLLIVLMIYLLSNVIRDKKSLIIATVLIIAAFSIFTILSIYSASRVTKMQTFIEILRNPRVILTEGSFMIRYARAWPNAYKQWVHSIVTFLFGNGIGYNPVVDGTFLRLLANQGIIGFIFFCYLWFGFYLQHFGKYKWIRMLLLFAFINGMTGDTLVVSFRTIQIYIVILLTASYSLEYIEKERIQEYE